MPHAPSHVSTVCLLLAGLAVVAAAGGETGKVPVTEHFAGKVTKITPEGEIEIRYDFEEKGQMADFEKSLPFRAVSTVEGTIENGRVRLKGTGSLRHKAVFKDYVAASAKFTPYIPYDFGFSVSEESKSEIFTLYCVRDRYFSKGDNVNHPQNMVIKFIPRDAGRRKDGYQDWRYCGSRGEKPGLRGGQTIDVQIRRGENKSFMQIDDTFTAKGKEAARDLTTQMLGIYGYKADTRFDDLVVTGVLHPSYVKRHNLDLEVEPEVVEDPDAAPKSDYSEEAAGLFRARIAAYPRQTKRPAMGKMLADVEVPLALRQEAAERIKANRDKKMVPYLLDALNSDDQPTRGLGADLVKGLTNSTFGFRPGDKPEKRKKAVQKLLAHVQKNARDFR